MDAANRNDEEMEYSYEKLQSPSGGVDFDGDKSSDVQNDDAGASDTEIRLGQTVPYSGPVSAVGTVGFASRAFFDSINKKGGINGRKIKLISLDDAYSPPKSVEATRRLVEGDEVLATFGATGTPTAAAAVQKYLNSRKVPQLLIISGGNRFNNPREFPWTVQLVPAYAAEARAAARYVLSLRPEPKIAIIYQNDDLGKDFVTGFKSGLGDKAATAIVSEQ